MTTQALRSTSRAGLAYRCLAAAVSVVLLSAASCGGDDDDAARPVEQPDTDDGTGLPADTDEPEEPDDDTNQPDEPDDDTNQPDEPDDDTNQPDEPDDDTNQPDEPDDDTNEPAGPDAETVTTTFDPVSGSDPKFIPTVSVTSDALVADDPSSDDWDAAGGTPDQVTLSGDQFWIRFEIENVDGFGAITSFSVDAEGLGSGLCTDVAPIPPIETSVCVAGPFPLAAGEQSIDLDYTASGERQVFGSQFISPLLTPPEFADAPISYFVLFATSDVVGQERGFLVDGPSTGPNIAVSGEVEGTLTLDCANPGAGIDLPVVAYGISYFDEGGGFREGCFDVDVLEQPFDRLAGDSTVNFTGA